MLTNSVLVKELIHADEMVVTRTMFKTPVMGTMPSGLLRGNSSNAFESCMIVESSCGSELTEKVTGKPLGVKTIMGTSVRLMTGHNEDVFGSSLKVMVFSTTQNNEDIKVLIVIRSCYHHDHQATVTNMGSEVRLF